MLLREAAALSMIQEVVKESAEGESCPDAEKCDKGAKKLTSEANDFQAKFKKCDEINAKLTAQMAANAKLEAAMRNRLAKANAKLKELAAARKIRMEKLAKYEAKDRAKEQKTKKELATVPGARKNLRKKKALLAAAKKKAKRLADIAHKLAGDPANIPGKKGYPKVQAASEKAAAAHSAMFVAEVAVSRAGAHMKNALKLAGGAKGWQKKDAKKL